MKISTTIIFGTEEVRKIHSGIALTTEEQAGRLKTHSFETEAEKAAFLKGIDEAVGWL